MLLLKKIKKVMALKMPMEMLSKMKKLKRKKTTRKKLKMTLKKLMRTRKRKAPAHPPKMVGIGIGWNFQGARWKSGRQLCHHTDRGPIRGFHR